ncbi:MAG: 5-formyltetrahydrofolate cyclo-ligase [Nodosilinea sp.]
MTSSTIVRQQVWDKLRQVAYPDSRFHYNLAEYIPDFVGSADALAQFVALPLYQNSHYLFITPDNCLTALREQALRDGKTLVVSTYGIYRGLILLEPDRIPPAEMRFASWLDGMESYGRSITLTEMAQGRPFDALVTGASAVSLQGLRFGKGHGFFDLEWGMFSAIGVVVESTPIAAFVHDVQVVEAPLTPGRTDVAVDWIITPTQVRSLQRNQPRPQGIQWDLLTAEAIHNTPPLQELQRQQSTTPLPRADGKPG